MGLTLSNSDLHPGCYQPTHLMAASLSMTRLGFPSEPHNVAPICHRVIGRNPAAGVIEALLRDVAVGTGALEAPVGVQVVVEGHAVHAQHVRLQVALLGGAVGAVAALEMSPAW